MPALRMGDTYRMAGRADMMGVTTNAIRIFAV
jgi:hypothetical protein